VGAANETLTALSLCDLADGIGAGDFSAEEAMAATLARIERLDPHLNAFIWRDGERALAQAREADAARARGAETGPLHGVPLAHKDMFYRPGRPSSCGSLIRRDFEGRETATVLKRLDAAGAIEVGTLAMVEFAMGPHGYNGHLPRCRNTWDFERIPCGSSSGSGTAVAGRLVHGALGSDTGGSIRCPAAANGVTGISPTYGRVSRFGAMPMSFSLDVMGPLARTARDCARLLGAIAGRDVKDASSSRERVQDYEGGLMRSIVGLRIGVPSGYFDQDLDPEVETLVEESLDVFKSRGASLIKIDMPEIVDKVAEIHPLVMKAEAAANHGNWKRAHGGDYSEEVGKRLEAGYFIPATDYINALQFRGQALQQFSDAVFSKVDVVHTPVLPLPTPSLADTTYSDGPAYLKMVVALTRNTKVVNYFGLPAISVPCGFTPDGLPTAFQLIGRPFSEDLLLRLGHQYQLETDWHERTPTAVADL
jgi:aspartyl-tRNA(Asn)/glutamyl-tRNA(Gln) amidotransferase subunit A